MIEIRAATVDDLEALLPLVRGYREFYKQTHDPEGERALMLRNLSEGRSSVYVAFDEGRIAGFMQIISYEGAVSLTPTVILEDLFVDPSVRQKGVAGRLLERAIEYARAMGASGMHLETAVDNVTAQRVYERCGWKREGRFLKYNAPL